MSQLSQFPNERRIAVEMGEQIRQICRFVEVVEDDDLRPLLDPLVMDDLTTIVALLESCLEGR